MMAAHSVVRYSELIAQWQYHILVTGSVDYFVSFSIQSLGHGTEEMNVGRMAEVNEDTHRRDRGGGL